MPLGIRPLNDLAFKLVFGTTENRESLISLLNATIRPKEPIVEVVIQNPYNLQDFQDDKLSIIDIKAVDRTGVIYHVEVQLAVPASLPQRMVFYNCELYSDQLLEGMDYAELCPVYSIWILNDLLWAESGQVHHAFRLTDGDSGRVLEGTEIHTLELAKYNLSEREAAASDVLANWLYWLKHAQEYEAEQLLKIFPQPAIRHATETLRRIAEKTEDKTMYDARERAIRDRKWELNSARREGKNEGKIEGKIEGKVEGKIEGKVEGKIETIRILQGLLYLPLGDEQELQAMNLEQLDAMASDLQERLRSRTST